MQHTLTRRHTQGVPSDPHPHGLTDDDGCAVITLYPDRLRDLWLARFHDDAGVLTLFGTDLLATAFTLRTPGLTVQREVQRLNPQVRVDLFDLDGITVHGAPPGP